MSGKCRDTSGLLDHYMGNCVQVGVMAHYVKNLDALPGVQKNFIFGLNKIINQKSKVTNNVGYDSIRTIIEVAKNDWSEESNVFAIDDAYYCIRGKHYLDR